MYIVPHSVFGRTYDWVCGQCGWAWPNNHKICGLCVNRFKETRGNTSLIHASWETHRKKHLNENTKKSLDDITSVLNNQNEMLLFPTHILKPVIINSIRVNVDETGGRGSVLHLVIQRERVDLAHQLFQAVPSIMFQPFIGYNRTGSSKEGEYVIVKQFNTAIDYLHQQISLTETVDHMCSSRPIGKDDGRDDTLHLKSCYYKMNEFSNKWSNLIRAMDKEWLKQIFRIVILLGRRHHTSPFHVDRLPKVLLAKIFEFIVPNLANRQKFIDCIEKIVLSDRGGGGNLSDGGGGEGGTFPNASSISTPSTFEDMTTALSKQKIVKNFEKRKSLETIRRVLEKNDRNKEAAVDHTDLIPCEVCNQLIPFEEFQRHQYKHIFSRANPSRHLPPIIRQSMNHQGNIDAGDDRSSSDSDHDRQTNDLEDYRRRRIEQSIHDQFQSLDKFSTNSTLKDEKLSDFDITGQNTTFRELPPMPPPLNFNNTLSAAAAAASTVDEPVVKPIELDLTLKPIPSNDSILVGTVSSTSAAASTTASVVSNTILVDETDHKKKVEPTPKEVAATLLVEMPQRCWGQQTLRVEPILEGSQQPCSLVKPTNERILCSYQFCTCLVPADQYAQHLASHEITNNVNTGSSKFNIWESLPSDDDGNTTAAIPLLPDIKISSDGKISIPPNSTVKDEDDNNNNDVIPCDYPFCLAKVPIHEYDSHQKSHMIGSSWINDKSTSSSHKLFTENYDFKNKFDLRPKPKPIQTSLQIPRHHPLTARMPIPQYYSSVTTAATAATAAPTAAQPPLTTAQVASAAPPPRQQLSSAALRCPWPNCLATFSSTQGPLQDQHMVQHYLENTPN